MPYGAAALARAALVLLDGLAPSRFGILPAGSLSANGTIVPVTPLMLPSTALSAAPVSSLVGFRQPQMKSLVRAHVAITSSSGRITWYSHS